MIALLTAKSARADLHLCFVEDRVSHEVSHIYMVLVLICFLFEVQGLSQYFSHEEILSFNLLDCYHHYINTSMEYTAIFMAVKIIFYFLFFAHNIHYGQPIRLVGWLIDS